MTIRSIQRWFKVAATSLLTTFNLWGIATSIHIAMTGAPGAAFMRFWEPLLTVIKPIPFLPAFQPIMFIPILRNADTMTALFQRANIAFAVVGSVLLTVLTTAAITYVLSIDIPTKVAKQINLLRAKRALRQAIDLSQRLDEIDLYELPVNYQLKLSPVRQTLQSALYSPLLDRNEDHVFAT